MRPKNCGECTYWHVTHSPVGSCRFLTDNGRMTERLRDILPLAAWGLEIESNQEGCRVGRIKKEEAADEAEQGT